MEAITERRLWDQDRDTARIRQAFVLLARTRRMWPAPVDFLDALPTIRQELLAPPKATPDPAKVAEVMRQVAKALGTRP
jgi:hypothetical protein